MATSVKKNADPDVQAQREGFAVTIRKAIAEEARAALKAGKALIAARATFNGDEMTDGTWVAWATSVTRKKMGTVDQYISIAKAHQSSTKEQRERTQDWTFEAQQRYATLKQDEREEVLAGLGAETNPTPERVAQVRDEVRLSKLSDEEREAAAEAKATREAENAASKTVALSKLISKDVAKIAALTDVRQIMVKTAALTQLHKGQDVVSALEHLFVQADEKARKAAEKKEKDEKAAASMAVLAEGRK